MGVIEKKKKKIAFASVQNMCVYLVSSVSLTLFPYTAYFDFHLILIFLVLCVSKLEKASFFFFHIKLFFVMCFGRSSLWKESFGWTLLYIKMFYALKLFVTLLLFFFSFKQVI